ncbi:tyrosine-type recombinase/integrase [Myxococcota bacterium]|nr:tyrosine-type recombinase/integrase [Myxococcota bacterium]
MREAVLVAPAKAATMREVFAAYLDELRRQGKDAHSVESAIRCWLDPALGQLRPDECDAARIAILVDAMRAAGRTNNTIRARCAFVRSALSFAHRARLVEANPLPNLRGVLPAKRTRPGFNPRGEILSAPALERLVCAPKVPHRERVQYLVAATAGLRVGELVELRVSDIDRHAPGLDDVAPEDRGAALHVTRQWCRKGKRVKPPKGGGPRTIAIRPDVLAALDRWLDEGWPRRYGRRATPTDLLFPADPSDDRRAEVPDLEARRQDDRAVLVRLHANLARVGLPKRRQHAFRHTFVSLLVNAGVPTDVAEQFTHPAPCATVEIYAHFSYRTLHEAVRRIPLRLREPTEQLAFSFADDGP